MRRRPDLRSWPRRGQCGFATIIALCCGFLCLVVGWVAMALSVAVAGQHHLDGSADLVAVSAATALQRGGPVCRVAARVAAANGVALRSCQVSGQDVVVSVSGSVGLPFGLRPAISARARAGPP